MKYWLISALFLSILLSLFVLQPFFIPHDKVVFLDIGQGDSVLFQSGIQQILIDGGANGQVLTRLSEEMPWFDRKVDVLIATHPDKDHMGGIYEVLKKYDVGLVIFPQVPHDTQVWQHFLEEVGKQTTARKIQYRFGWQGDKLILQNLKFQFLSPTQALIQGLHGTTNDGSIVARADMHNTSFLLTADAEWPAEMSMMAARSDLLHVDVLKVGHHGSKSSTSAVFLDAVRPKLAAISVGAHNSYGHPNPVTLDRLANYNIPTFRTDLLGSIRLNFVINKWLLSCAKKSCTQ